MFGAEQARIQCVDPYFEPMRRNQVEEIKIALAQLNAGKEDEVTRVELVKRIVLYTSQGVDTSRLYPQMVMASATKDPVQKKLIFGYLACFSQLNGDFARMAINTFTKDGYSVDPQLRCLALRHLSNLRFRGSQQYVRPILQSGLSDPSGLVKRSCLIGFTKLLRQCPPSQRPEQLLKILYQLLRDPDLSVLCAALVAINQIEPQGIVLSKKLATFIISKLGLMSDIQLPQVLGLLPLFEPKQEEILGFTNSLLQAIDRRAHSVSVAVIVAVARIYLWVAQLRPQLESVLLQRVRRALISHCNCDSPQQQYIVLCHIARVIQQHSSHPFTQDLPRFYLGGCLEPTYIKLIKIKLICLLTQQNNFADVVNQLLAYAFEQNVSKESLRALSQLILLAGESDARFALKSLMKAIEESECSHLCNNAVPLVRNYLRVYPNDLNLVGNAFAQLARHARDEESRCALLQIIGDFGQLIEEAVELIGWRECTGSESSQLCFLRASVKLFLKRPSQMINAVQKLLSDVLKNEDTHLSVRDYAAFLYRGLELEFDTFYQQFLLTRDKKPKVVKLPVLLQFDSFEAVYGLPKEQWLLDEQKHRPLHQEPQFEREEEEVPREAVIDLEVRYKPLEHSNMEPGFEMSTEEFESAWSTLDIGSSMTRVLKKQEVLSEDLFDELFRTWGMGVMATLEDSQTIKLYGFCKVIQEGVALGLACVELCVLKEASTLTLLVRCQQDELAVFVSKYVEEFFLLNQLI